MDATALARDPAPTTISSHVAENIDRVLSSIRSYLKMDVAFVSEFLGQNRIFRNVDCADREAPYRVGDVIPMAAGYCRHIASGQLPELIPDTREIEFAWTIPETTSIPIGSHLSVPIQLDGGRTFGTFCCFSHLPNPLLDKRDLELLRTFGRMLANDLTADLKLEAERRTTANRIGSAIELGDPQIVFQPIIRLDDQAVVGVECLARFASDRNLSPDLWFADAYKVGLGHQLELLAVRKALACSSDLPVDLTVSVNISPATLITGDVLDALRGFDHRRLIIEVTEHVPIDNYDPILLAIAPIRASGVRVAIDDAGAGYSSLRHILAMRPDIIKFDISLTRGVDTDPVRQAMAAALSEFARRTRTSVVAEGVETEGEFRTLRDLKFDKGQGYYFGRPQELPDFLRGFAGKLAAHR